MSQVFGNQPYNANIWQRHLEPVNNITQQAMPQLGTNTVVPPQSIWNNPNLAQANSFANNSNLVPQNTAMLQTQGQDFIDNQPGLLSRTMDGITDGLGSMTDEGGLFTRESMLGGESGAGWLTGLAQAGSNAMGAYTGYQQYKLGKEQLAFNKDVTRTNLANQANLTNQRLNNAYNNQYAAASDAERQNMLTPEQYREQQNVKGNI